MEETVLERRSEFPKSRCGLGSNTVLGSVWDPLSFQPPQDSSAEVVFCSLEELVRSPNLQRLVDSYLLKCLKPRVCLFSVSLGGRHVEATLRMSLLLRNPLLQEPSMWHALSWPTGLALRPLVLPHLR